MQFCSTKHNRDGCGLKSVPTGLFWSYPYPGHIIEGIWLQKRWSFFPISTITDMTTAKQDAGSIRNLSIADGTANNEQLG